MATVKQFQDYFFTVYNLNTSNNTNNPIPVFPTCNSTYSLDKHNQNAFKALKLMSPEIRRVVISKLNHIANSLAKFISILTQSKQSDNKVIIREIVEARQHLDALKALNYSLKMQFKQILKPKNNNILMTYIIQKMQAKGINYRLSNK